MACGQTVGRSCSPRRIRQWAHARSSQCLSLHFWPPCAREVERSFRSDFLCPLQVSDDTSAAAWQRTLAAWRNAYNARARRALRPRDHVALTT